MKNLIKLLFSAFLLIIVSINLYAQVEATSPASAQVEAALTLVREAGTEIDFGTLSATTSGDIILDPNDPHGASVNTGTNVDVARFNLGGANIPVNVTYDGIVLLTELGEGSSTMTMTPKVVGAPTLVGQITAGDISEFPAPNRITPIGGEYYFWIGGTIEAITNQVVGDYVGEFTLGIEYQ